MDTPQSETAPKEVMKNKLIFTITILDPFTNSEIETKQFSKLVEGNEYFRAKYPFLEMADTTLTRINSGALNAKKKDFFRIVKSRAFISLPVKKNKKRTSSSESESSPESGSSTGNEFEGEPIITRPKIEPFIPKPNFFLGEPAKTKKSRIELDLEQSGYKITPIQQAIFDSLLDVDNVEVKPVKKGPKRKVVV